MSCLSFERSGGEFYNEQPLPSLSAWLFLRFSIWVLQLNKACSRSYILVDFIWAGFGGDHGRRNHTHHIPKSLLFPPLCTFPRLTSSFLFLPVTQFLNNPHQHNVLVIVQWGWHLDSQYWKKSHGFGFTRTLNLTNPEGPGVGRGT